MNLDALGAITRFVEAWCSVQAGFVDDPHKSVSEADRLVSELMTARGYPAAEFEQRVPDVSVDHRHVVDNYRTARDTALRDQRGEAGTEDLRHRVFRDLFEELLETPVTERPAA